MAKFGMVVDLDKCVGCGACMVACKVQNNVQDGIKWCDAIVKTEGTFPDIKHTHTVTMCNHCTNAPCVASCPTKPKSMSKSDNGITTHNPKTCIGCRNCERACPYGMISFNKGEIHPFWKDKLGQETVMKAGGNVTPYYNPEVDFRKKGIVEKCTFCQPITVKGEKPYCAQICPPAALTFGDLDDPNSDVSKLLKTYKATRLLEEKNTGANVYYIREYVSRK